jgi:hypothetical protein
MSSIKGINSSIRLRTTTLAACLAAIAVLAVPSALSAQLGRVAFGLKAGTLGLGAEASLGITRHIAVRAGLNRFNLERGQEFGDIDYRLTPRLRSLTALLDLHPFGGAFRLSGGIVSNRNEGGLDAQLDRSGSLFIGEGEYAPNDVQGLTGKIGFKRSAPYLGFGFDNSLLGRGRVSFNMDLGVMFHGHPKATLQGQTTLTGDARAQFDADVEREAQEVQEKIDDLPRVIDYFPVLAFGLKVRP